MRSFTDIDINIVFFLPKYMRSQFMTRFAGNNMAHMFVVWIIKFSKKKNPYSNETMNQHKTMTQRKYVTINLRNEHELDLVSFFYYMCRSLKIILKKSSNKNQPK